MSTFRNRLSKVLLPTYAAYFAVTFARKPFAIVKSRVTAEIGLAPDILGWIDTSFLLMYTIGNFVFPYLTGVQTKYILLFSAFTTAIALYLLSFSDTALHFLVVQGFHGLVQSVAWPACVGIVSPWIAPNERGRVMGFWGTHQTMGGLAGGLIAGWFAATTGWKQAIQICAATVFGVTVLVLFTLRPGTPPVSSAPAIGTVGCNQPPKTAGVTTVLRTRGVPLLCASYFFHKLVRYGLLWWAPYYLNHVLGHSLVESALASTALDIGGALGGPVVGIIGDMYKGGRRRVFVLMVCVLISVIGVMQLVLFPTANANSIGLCALAFFICGVSFYGADALCTGVLVQDIADRAGNPCLAGPICAVLAGLGAAGTVLQGPLCGIVAREYGWSIVLVVLATTCFLGGVVLLPEVVRERAMDISGSQRVDDKEILLSLEDAEGDAY